MWTSRNLTGGALLLGALITAPAAAGPVEANQVAETTLVSATNYANPFTDAQLDAVVTQPDGAQLRVPGFWSGGTGWRFRYASGKVGTHAWRTECSDTANSGLHGVTGSVMIAASTSTNVLFLHGPIRVAADQRHFEHADGTPFFWLGDTWWKGLCDRIPWEGFQELTADRKAKGFTVVQIIGGGPYPDEPPFDSRWKNEGGLPYEKDYACINPKYFDFADRRIEHLIGAGIVPAMVGGWGWHMPSVGVEKMNRHWRYLIARYGAYPVVWIVAGEIQEARWQEVAGYVRKTDPYHRLATMHPPGIPELQSGRKAMNVELLPGDAGRFLTIGRLDLHDDTLLDFDLLQTSHNDWGTAPVTVSQVTASYSKTPPMPVVNGEVVYEWHKNAGRQDIQRFMFWSCMLNGAAGHTYGAGGIWQMNSKTVRGSGYESTPWFVAMRYPGSAQLGLGKKLLEEYPWWRFEPHPEWVEPRSTTLFEPHAEWYDNHKVWAERKGRWDLPYAAGIPGEVRFVYIPGNNDYRLTAPVVLHLEPNVNYRAFLFDPLWGQRFDLGPVVKSGPSTKRSVTGEEPKPFEGHTKPLLFADIFDGADASAWKDYGTPSQRKAGRLAGGKGLVTILEKISETNLMASVEANSDAEAGIILRFQDPDNYLVALYSPESKSIYVHDRKNGSWGDQLGSVAVPEIGPRFRLTAAACGESAAMVLTDGTKTYWTPIVEVSNIAGGKAGVWLYRIGERQEFGDFELSRASFEPAPVEQTPAGVKKPADEYRAPQLPSPQDWVLVLGRVKP
ncbi:MAG: DUF4038 domain-containing protein [bacterium]